MPLPTDEAGVASVECRDDRDSSLRQRNDAAQTVVRMYEVESILSQNSSKRGRRQKVFLAAPWAFDCKDVYGKTERPQALDLLSHK